MQLLGSLFVLVPMLLGALKWTITVYEKYDSLIERIERLERWKCAMGTKPSGSTEWPASDWSRTCPSRSAPRPEE